MCVCVCICFCMFVCCMHAWIVQMVDASSVFRTPGLHPLEMHNLNIILLTGDNDVYNQILLAISPILDTRTGSTAGVLNWRYCLNILWGACFNVLTSRRPGIARGILLIVELPTFLPLSHYFSLSHQPPSKTRLRFKLEYHEKV